VTLNKNTKIMAALFALIAISIALTYTTYAALTANQTLNSVGNVKTTAGLGIYQDSACTTPLTNINWGNATPGSAITEIIYVKNIGQGTSLALSMATSGWNPTNASGPITVTWNCEGTRVYPGQSVAAVLTANVSPTIADISNFNVQITITGTQ
jgi:hypothetical protein